MERGCRRGSQSGRVLGFSRPFWVYRGLDVGSGFMMFGVDMSRPGVLNAIATGSAMPIRVADRQANII